MSEKKSTGNGFSSEPISERMRLIRFRMAKEHSSFAAELRLIPRKLIQVTISLYLVAMAVVQAVVHYTHELPFDEFSRSTNHWVAAGLCTLVSVFIAALLFLIGYVHSDARRRGMNATLWTILVVILLPAWLALGFIIYFLLREPLPYLCPQCSASVSARFNYCPNCKFNLRPTCPQCRREVRLGDRFCPHCASELASNETTGFRGGDASGADLGTAV
jgi:uncharacterized membrane protein